MSAYNRFTTTKPVEKKVATTTNRFTMNPVASTPAPAPTVKPEISLDPKAPAPSVYKPEPVKPAYSFMENVKPLDIKLPEPVSKFIAPIKEDYQQREEVIKTAGEKQRAFFKPLEEAIRKPLQAGMAAVEYTKDAPTKILNHPAVAPVLVEVAKRTSGTGIVSAVQAIGPTTFDEAYKANRAYQAGDPSKLNQFLYQLGDSAPQTAIGVALNFVPFVGRPLSTSYWTALSAADQIENKGSVTSLGNIGIDVLGDRMLGNSIEALFKAPAKTLMQTAVQNFGVEGGTEVAQDLLKMQNDYINAKTPEEKSKILAGAKEYFTSGQILMTFGVGGLSGAAVGTGAYTINQTLPPSTVADEEKGLTTPEDNKRVGFETPPEQSRFKDGPEIINYIGQKGAGLGAQLNQTEMKQMIEHLVSQGEDNKVVKLFGKPIERGTVYRSYGGGTDVVLGKVSVPGFGESVLVAQLNKNGTLDGRFRTHGTPIENKDIITKLGDNSLLQLGGASQEVITDSENEDRLGHKQIFDELDRMEKTKILLPEDATIIKTLLEGTSDEYLKSLRFGEKSSRGALGTFSVPILPRFRGSRKPKVADMSRVQEGHFLALSKRLAARGEDATRIFSHEFGHAGWYLILTDEERAMVNDVYLSLGGKKSKSIFDAGLGGNTEHHAENVREFFAQSFAEYIMTNKIPPAQLKPLYQRLAVKFFEGLKKLVNRQENVAADKLRPLFERALRGDKTTPLADLMAQEPTSFKQQVQQMFQEAPTKEVPPKSIFPSMAVQDNKIEPPTEEFTPYESPMDTMQQAYNEAMNSGIDIEPPQKVFEETKRTPTIQKVGWWDRVMRTPWRVLERLGLKQNYLELMDAYLAMSKESLQIRAKIRGWMDSVPKESNERIFRALDGEKIELNPQEEKVKGEIKAWLSEWADRLGMSPDARISSYITHIFPIQEGGEIPEEIALLIRHKIPGEVYDPFLLQREGAEGYLKDTWKALDAYAKRAKRKVHLDPALKSFKAASVKLKEASQVQYVEDYIHHLNMRPTVSDTNLDNDIKKVFGGFFGPRPTRTITTFIRRLISRAKIGGSMVSFAKNLTQGVNTFKELGTRYTISGYMDLAKFGGKELEDNGVLIDPIMEDQTYSAVKKWAERFDKVLFLNMNASELVNRGAAYYGAKQMYMDGNVPPRLIKEATGKEMKGKDSERMEKFKKDFPRFNAVVLGNKFSLDKEAFAKYYEGKTVEKINEKGEKYEISLLEEDAIAYARFVASKTQFTFGALDTPVAMSSDQVKTWFQFGTFTVKQQELFLQALKEKEWLQLFRYMTSSMLMFAFIGGAFGMKWSDSFPFVKLGLPPAFQFILDLWQIFVTGEDDYKNKLSPGDRAKEFGKTFLTNVVPGGAQIKRSYEGFTAVNEGGVKNKQGYYDYKIAKTPMNYVKGTLFGKYNLPEAKAYTESKESGTKKTTSRKRF